MKTNSTPEKTIRSEYEQLEYQRIHPELFTTLSQSVEPYGAIVAFDDVTKNMRKTLAKLQEHHTRILGGKHPDYCQRPPYWQSSAPVCEMIDMLNEDMAKVRAGFVRNYRYVTERIG